MLPTINEDEICAYMEDSQEAEKAAKERYKQLKADNKPNLRLVRSSNQFTEGWWVEWGETGAKPLTSPEDYLVPEEEMNTIETAY